MDDRLSDSDTLPLPARERPPLLVQQLFKLKKRDRPVDRPGLIGFREVVDGGVKLLSTCLAVLFLLIGMIMPAQH